MSLALIEQSIRANRSAMSVQAWRETEDLRAQKVERFRRYAEGDHDNRMTGEQKRLLNIRGGVENSTEFNDNLCSIILDTMLDRIQLLGVNASSGTAQRAPVQPTDIAASDPLQDWVDDLLARNRIDALQVDVHEATLRDGNSFLMVYPDEVSRLPQFSHEPAYDGSYGMVVLYETANSPKPMLAIKVWKVSSTNIADTVRVNVYYEDRIERFSGESAAGLKAYSGDGEPATIPWVMPDGTPIGVPVIHFRNRGSSVDNFGLSELENVIPLQDASNTVLLSMVATALLSGFPIRGLVGGVAPAAVVPGMMLSFDAPHDANGNPVLTSFGAGANTPTAIDLLNAVRFLQYETGDLSQLIEVAKYLKGEMYAVTNTPTDDVAADASGEARKQSEVKLIGKVNRFEVRNGNAWEDAVRMAARVQTVFASEPVPIDDDTRLNAQWALAEVRNDSVFVEDMLKQYREGVIDQRTYLEKVADIYDYSPEDIDQIIERTDGAKNAAPPTLINQQDADGAQALLERVMGGQDTPTVEDEAEVNDSIPPVPV
jgi:hypothetical protein